MSDCEHCRDQGRAEVAAAVKTVLGKVPTEVWSGRSWVPNVVGVALADAVRAALADTADVLAARDARVGAAALRDAADGIQALHPGETKASVLWLRARADRVDPDTGGDQ